MITQERLRLGSWNFIGTLVMTGRWPLLIFRSLGQSSRSQVKVTVTGNRKMVSMITQDRLCLGSWNFIGTLVMTGRWPLLILRSLGQRSRSQWPEAVKWFPDDNSRTLRPGITKLHRDIGHDRQMTPIDFQVTRSKVKVAMTLSSKMVDWK